MTSTALSRVNIPRGLAVFQPVPPPWLFTMEDGERFFAFFTANIRTRTRDAPTMRPSAASFQCGASGRWPWAWTELPRAPVDITQDYRKQGRGSREGSTALSRGEDT